jgi:hypothetical protein
VYTNLSKAEPKTDDPKSGRGSRADIAPEHYIIEEETPRDMVKDLPLVKKRYNSESMEMNFFI